MKNLLLGFILVLSDKKVTPKSSLKAVFLLMRHGDRSPTWQYPKDPHNFYRWRGGLGALTKRGEDQMITCGAVKRKRYGSLFDETEPACEMSNIAVLSSTVERCVISARKFLDGFLNKKCHKTKINVLSETEDELMRHGDRSPTWQYPKDPHNFYRWRGGLGALTKRGEDQMITCGAVKRKRYGSLFDETEPACEMSNIAVLSSTVERCVISARKFLDGFLNKKCHKTKINVLSETEDEFLVVRGKKCPKYYMSFYESVNFNNPVVERYFRMQQISSEFFDYIEANTGMKIYSLMEVHGLADILHVQQRHGLTPPKWFNTSCQSTLLPLACFTYKLMIRSDYLRIRSGVLIRDIIERIDKYLSNESKENIVIYSAHDLTISALVEHLDLGAQLDFKPDYGACFAVELYENPSISNDLEVKLFFFRDFADENPIKLRIRNCEAPCSLNKFKELMQPKITQNYEEACRKDEYCERKSMGETISAHSVHNCNDNNNPASSISTQNRQRNEEQNGRRTRERKRSQVTLKQTNSKVMKKASKTASAYSKGKSKRSRSRRRAEQSDDDEAMETDQATEENGSANEDANSSSSMSSSASNQRNQSRHDVRKIDTADALHLSKRTSTTRPSSSKNNPLNIVPVDGAAALNSLSQNPFFNYLQDLRKKYKDLSVQELAKKGGQKWRGMSMEEKFPYYVMAKKYREYRLKRLQKGPERAHSGSKPELKNENPSKSNVSRKTRKSNSKNFHKKKQDGSHYHPYVS